jgi:two-component system sensor histidine kinase UhpB
VFLHQHLKKVVYCFEGSKQQTKIKMNEKQPPGRLNMDDQQQQADSIREREEKYRFLVEHIHDIVYTMTSEGILTFVSPVWTELLGHTVNEVVGKSFQVFVYPDDLSACFAWLQKVVDSGTRQEGIEYRVQHKNGKWFWHTSSAVPFKDSNNNVAGYYGLATDITERKRFLEEKIAIEQQALLAEHTEKAVNSERESISRDLHDELGQVLSAINMHLGFIRQKISDNEIVLKINKVSTLVGEAMSSVKRITGKLRPEILNELGLEEAIRWYAKEFAERNGVGINLKIHMGIALSMDISHTIFRIIQESLTNISRHAKATKIYIGLNISKDTIVIRVSDNGIGIKKDEIESKTSWGIISMKERAQSLGGTFDIYGIPGDGTVIKIVIPVVSN